MQWIWVLPSLGFGIYLFATTGQASGLIFGGFSIIAVGASAVLARKKQAVNLKDPVRFGRSGKGAVRVAIGNRILPRWQWLWQAPWVDRVYQDLELQNSKHTAFKKLEDRVGGNLASTAPGFSAWLGFDGGTELNLDLDQDGAHALVVGATGAGKSQLLTVWLVSLAQKFDTTQLEYWLIDLKGGATFGRLVQAPVATRFATDLDGGAPSLVADLVAEMERRELLCANLGVSRVADLPATDALPRIVLVVDEAQQLLPDFGIQAHIANLAARGRSLGIHLILAVQSLSGMPRQVLANLGARVSVGKSDPVELAQLGYQRQTAQVQESEASTPRPEAQLAGWGNAVFIGPNRQASFAFPSGGKVSCERLFAPSSAHLENVFSAPAESFTPEIGHKSTDSVEIPKHTFDFSIGLEKQLPFTAQIDIV